MAVTQGEVERRYALKDLSGRCAGTQRVVGIFNLSQSILFIDRTYSIVVTFLRALLSK